MVLFGLPKWSFSDQLQTGLNNDTLAIFLSFSLKQLSAHSTRLPQYNVETSKINSLNIKVVKQDSMLMLLQREEYNIVKSWSRFYFKKPSKHDSVQYTNENLFVGKSAQGQLELKKAIYVYTIICLHITV